MSNTSGEYCVRPGEGSSPSNLFLCNNMFLPCSPGSFMDAAANDSAVNHTTLAFADGAYDTQTANAWFVGTPGRDPHEQVNYKRVRECILTPMGFSEPQVQVIWLK